MRTRIVTVVLLVGLAFSLMGRVTDLYLMVIPPIAPVSPRPAVLDVAILALVASGFVLLTLRAFFQAELIPIGDPLLPESVHGPA